MTSDDGWLDDGSMTSRIGRAVRWRYDGTKSSFEYQVSGRPERFWHSVENFTKLRNELGSSGVADVIANRIMAYLAGKEDMNGSELPEQEPNL